MIGEKAITSAINKLPVKATIIFIGLALLIWGGGLIYSAKTDGYRAETERLQVEQDHELKMAELRFARSQKPQRYDGFTNYVKYVDKVDHNDKPEKVRNFTQIPDDSNKIARANLH